MKLYELFLLEDVSNNHVYHGTDSDIQSISNQGLKSNEFNKDRTGSNLRSISFTRNLRYAFAGVDDDGDEIANFGNNSVVLVFDRNKLKQRNKLKPIAHGDALNYINKIIDAIKKIYNDKLEIKDNYKKYPFSLLTDKYKIEKAEFTIAVKIIAAAKELNIIDTFSSIMVIKKVISEFFNDITSDKEYTNAMSQLKNIARKINQYTAGKSYSKDKKSDASEYSLI